MPYYQRRGSIPPKRHVEHRVGPGESGYRGEGIHYEEVITTQGFSRAYSIVYHRKPPTRVKRIEPLPDSPLVAEVGRPLSHRHLKTASMPAAGDPITGRVPLFFNQDCVIARCRPDEAQRSLYRNARCDELIFVHRGSGRLLSQFGSLEFRPFDYLVVPKCLTYRLEFDQLDHSTAPADRQVDMLVVESVGDLGFPPRYLNPDGQFRLGAPFGERDLRAPEFVDPIDDEGEFAITIKDDDRRVNYVLASHPFDVVGWDGLVYPFAFSADDFEPITGTIHQPPPIHQTFQSSGFVVCTFAPRMLDTHPSAIKIPYAHSNVESDELLYYVRGRFGSRRGVEIGSITMHPHGVPHGPHPGTIVASRSMTRTDELAVMVDTFRPLKTAAAAGSFDDSNYPFTWID